jgi:hypothetical protein
MALAQAAAARHAERRSALAGRANFFLLVVVLLTDWR